MLWLAKIFWWCKIGLVWWWLVGLRSTDQLEIEIEIELNVSPILDCYLSLAQLSPSLNQYSKMDWLESQLSSSLSLSFHDNALLTHQMKKIVFISKGVTRVTHNIGWGWGVRILLSVPPCSLVYDELSLVATIYTTLHYHQQRITQICIIITYHITLADDWY